MNGKRSKAWLGLVGLTVLVTVLFTGGGGVERVGAVPKESYEGLETFTNILSIVQKNYVEEVETRRLIEGAINGMLVGLDPHSAYLSPDLYKELSATLQLDGAAFAGCLTDPGSAAKVDADLAYGQSVGVRGTPSFFVGRVAKGQLVDARRIRGAKPFTVFAREIESLLR